MNENNLQGLSSPMSEADAVNLLSGITDPDDGQVDNETDDTETLEATEEVVEEEVEVEAEESNETDDSDQEVELDSEEYDELVNLRAFLSESGLKSADQVKGGVMMQKDYTQKTQALSKDRKEFESSRDQQLQQTAELLEIAQAMVYGQKPEYTTQELLALKDKDPSAYEQALESRVTFDQRKAEIDGVAQKVRQQHEQAKSQQSAEYVQEQSNLLIQMEPDFASPDKAKEKVEVMTGYFESIGGSAEQLAQVTDAIALKVLHDAAFGMKAGSQAKSAKSKGKKPQKRVIRRSVSANAAQKRQAGQAKRAKELARADGSLSVAGAAQLLNDITQR